MKVFGLGIFVLVASVILANSFLYEEQLKENWKKEYHSHKMAFYSKKHHTLFLGDSRTYYGVNPEIFKDALNFAFPSNSFSQSYLERSEKLLKAKGTIYLGLTAEALSAFNMNDAIEKHLKNKIALWDLAKCLIRIWWPHWDLSLFLKRGWDAVKFRVDSNSYSVNYHSNGWWEAYPKSKTPDSLARHYQENLARFPVEQRFINNLVEKIKNWKKSEIMVFAFYPPASKSVRNAEDNRTQSKFEREKIKETLIQAGARWLDIDPNTYETFDGDHLDSLEAKRMSQQLLKQSLLN